MPDTQFGKQKTARMLALAWGVAVFSGMLAMLRYDMTPGADGKAAPKAWPSAVRDIPLNQGGLTLVMLVHPQCTCSRASLHELLELMSRSEGRVSTHVLFVKPAGAPVDWCDSDTWKQAGEIPGARVAVDEDGHDAAAFGATTSGQVLIYDSSGTLQYSGGITDGRGHEGDNTGLSAILSLVRTGQTPVAAAPVYGCSLGVCRIQSSVGSEQVDGRSDEAWTH